MYINETKLLFQVFSDLFYGPVLHTTYTQCRGKLTFSKSMKTMVFPVTTEILVNEDGVLNLKELTCELLLSFDDKGKCTITSATDEFKASGSGKFVKNGERKAWGNKDRDALYLDYKIDFSYMQYETKDTLVARNRGISSEVFSPSYVE